MTLEYLTDKNITEIKKTNYFLSLSKESFYKTSFCKKMITKSFLHLYLIIGILPFCFGGCVVLTNVILEWEFTQEGTLN